MLPDHKDKSKEEYLLPPSASPNRQFSSPSVLVLHDSSMAVT